MTHAARHNLARIRRPVLGDALKRQRNRAILAVLLLYLLRRKDLARLCVKDFNQERQW